MSSFGIKRTLNSGYYKGEFNQFLKEGKGIEITIDYEYEGEFKQDKKYGKGKIILKNGECYEGVFKEDQISGYVLYT